MTTTTTLLQIARSELFMRNGLLKVLILLDDTGIRELEVLKQIFRVM